jgi:3-phenylpropionate/trans-cinnamate dioxygenase ferredoxin reductase subunit
LSKDWLTRAEEPPPLYLRPAEGYAEAGIELRLGVAAEAILPVERLLRLEDGEVLAYDRLLLTTGGRARHLSIPGAEHALTLRTIEDARAIRARLPLARSVVCIGAGVIGLEIAASAAKLGAQVTVLEAAGAPMGRAVSAAGADFIARLHRAAGVALHFHETVERIEQAGGRYLVICADGRMHSTELVVAGVGMERSLELARAAGLALDLGIAVDTRGETSVPGIYAAGDVAAFEHPFYGRRLRLESWRHAQNHGLAVGKAMAGEAIRYDDIPWFWTEQHGVNLQVTGLAAEAVHTMVRADDGRQFSAVHLDADGVVIGITAAGLPRDIRAGTALIKARARPDPDRLADASVPLSALAS